METIPHKERICRQLKNSAGLFGPNLRELWSQVLEKTGAVENQINSFNIEEHWTKNFGPKYHNPGQDSSSKAKSARSTRKKGTVKKEKLETSDTEYSEGSEDYVPKRVDVAVPIEPLPEVEKENVLVNPDGAFDPNGVYNFRRNTRSSLHSRQNSFEDPADSSDSYQTFTETVHKRKRVKSKAEDKFSRMEKDWLACQQSMTNLATLGYRIESKVDGEWVQPEILRLYGPGHDVSDTDQPKNSTLDHLVMAAEWAYAGRL
jgi:hypothetical protein